MANLFTSATLRRLGNWALPLFLLVLPILVCRWQAARETEQTRQELGRRWRQEAPRVAEVLQQCSRPQFWVEEAVRRTRRQFSRMAQAVSAPAALGERLRSAWHHRLPRAFPEHRLWCVRLDRANLGSPGSLESGTGLDNQFGYFMSRLAWQLARRLHGLPHQLDSTDWLGRLRGMFGPGVFPDLFAPQQRGQAFAVILQGRQGLLCWDVVHERGVPVAAIITFVPIDRDQWQRTLTLTRANWRDVVPETGVGRAWPVFLPLPITPGPTRRASLAPLAVRRSRAATHLVTQLSRQLRIDAPPVGMRLVPGKPRLLSWATGRVFRCGQWRAAIVPLDPGHTHLGLVVARMPAEKPQVFAQVAWLATMAMMAALGLALGHRLTRCRWPTPGVRLELVLWFVGLAAVPIILALGAGANLHNDQRLDALRMRRQQMQQTVEQLDNGSVRWNQRFEQALRARCLDPALGQRLKAIQLDKRSPMPVLEGLRHDLASVGLRVRGVIVFGHRGFCEQAFSQNMPLDQQKALVSFTRIVAGEVLKHVPAELATYSFSASSDGSLQRAAGLSEKALANNMGMWSSPDQIDAVGVGSQQLMKYHSVVRFRGTAWFVLMVCWDHEPVYRHDLRSAVPATILGTRNRAADAALDIAVFKRVPLGLERVAPRIDRTGLWRYARQAGRQATWLAEATEVGGRPAHLVLVQRSKSQTDYLFVARASLVDLNQAQQASWQHLLLSVSVLLVMVALGAAGLSRRLSSPIVAMTQGLRRVAAGDLTPRLAIARNDEMGDATATLDRMTEWLVERRKLTRFVSSHVLTVIRGSGIESRQETRIDTAVLVSDIRNFTTLTEAHSPRVIFAALNRHLAAMAEVIQSHGGTIDRFIGDAIVAVFPATSPEDRPEQRAVAAARAMMLAHAQLQQERQKRGLFAYGIGVGIDRGLAVAGVVGDPLHRLDYTMLGEPIHQAAKMEAASKHAQHTRICCSVAVWHGIRDLIPCAPVIVPDSDIEAWEVVGLDDAPQRPDPAPALPTTSPIRLNQAEPAGAVAASPRESSPPPSTGPLVRASDPATDGPSRSLMARITGRALAAAAIILLLLLPPWLVLSAGHAWQREQSERSIAVVLQELRDDVRLLERAVEPHAQLLALAEADVQESCRQATPAAAPFQTLTARLRARLNRLASVTPTLSYACMETRHTDRFGNTYPYRIGWSTTLATGGHPLPMSDRQLELLHYYVTAQAGIATGQGGLGPSVIPNLLGSTTRGIWLPRHVMGRWLPVTIGPRTTLVTWLPLFAPARWEIPLGAAKTLNLTADAESELGMPHFWGGVFLFLEPQRLGADQAAWATIANLAAVKARVAIAPTGTPRRVWQHRDYGRNQTLGDILRRRLHAQIQDPQVWRVHDWIAMGTNAGPDRSWRALVARQIPAGTILSTIVSPLLNLLILVWWLAWWRALTVGATGRSGRRQPLQRQLVLGFILLLAPVVALALFTRERALAAERHQVQGNISQRLTDQLGAISDSAAIARGWILGLYNAVIDDPAFGHNLARVEKTRTTKNKRATSGNDPALRDTVNTLIRRGILFRYLYVTSRDGMSISFGHRRGELGGDGLMELILDQGQRVMNLLNPDRTGTADKAEAARQLVLAAEFEGVAPLLPAIMPVSLITNLIGQPRLLIEMSARGTQGCFVRSFLRHEGEMKYNVFLTYTSLSMDAITIDDWRSARLPVARHLLIGRTDLPNWLYAPPCFMTIPSTDAETVWIEPIDTMRCTDETRLMNQAAAMKEARTRVIGEGPGARLLVANVGGPMDGTCFLTSAPLGRILGVIDREANEQRAVFALLLLVPLILTIRAATLFLQPLFDLSQAAGRIMANDFSVRIATTRADEFGVLFNAFNQMAEGVAEGRVLGRFVSESVQAVVQADDRESAARKGEALTAVVLFAGVEGFTDRLRQEPPQQVIAALNRHLERVSQILRTNHGVLDKFIGDKVLAVFTADRCGSLENAVRLAATAAQAMVQQSAADRQLPGRHLGVGMVTGRVVAGLLGTSEVRLEYTVIGDTVNLASRLCDVANQQRDGGIVLDQATTEILLQDRGSRWATQLRRLDISRVKGKTRELEVYGLTVTH